MDTFLKRCGLYLIATALLCALPLASQAEEPAADISPFRISGFGTLARSWDSRDNLAPIRDVSQRPVDDYRTGPTWKLDSRIGLQAAYRFTPDIEAVAQIVGRDQVSSEFHHFVELGYLDIQLPQYFRLRLGRVGFDAYLMSDHRNVGYAYAWMRPPIEFYGWTPMFSVDGGDLSYSFEQGDSRWRLRVQAGKNDFVAPMGPTQFNFHGTMTGVSVVREQGPWRMKAAFTRIFSTQEVPALAPLHQGLESVAGHPFVGPAIRGEAAYLRENIAFDNQHMHYLTLGAAYDDGTWLGQAEIGTSRTTSVFTPAATTAYAIVGRRFGSLTPFAILSASRPDTSIERPRNDWSGLGPAASGLQTEAYIVINETRTDQATFSLGTRWDVSANAALKFQLDHSRIKEWGYSSWFRSRAGQTRDSSVNLLSIGVDFIF